MDALMTVAEVMRRLLDECDQEGGIRPWAEARNLHPSIIDKFLSGQRAPSPQLLAAMGLTKEVRYRRIKSIIKE